MGLNIASVVEIEFTAGAWTDVTADVVGDLNVLYGIQGNGPNDRMASTGTFDLTFKNSPTNSARLRGYYSPGHANCRAGFAVGKRLRWRVNQPVVDDGGFVSSAFDAMSFVTGATARTFFLGKIDAILPDTGQYRTQRTTVRAVDWVDTLAALTTHVELQLSKRTDQVISAILSGMTEQPESSVIRTGDSTFTYALDNMRDESTRALAALASLMQSEGGYGYVRGNGGFVFDNRLYRAAVSPEFTLDNTMADLTVECARDVLYNKVQVTVHPRRIDAAATTVLWSLGTATEVAPGETVTFLGGYGDPLNGNQRCGGTAMVAPVASTDDTMNTVADGSGTDLTASFIVTPSATTSTSGVGANGVSWSVTNNGAVSGFITKLQIRGKGIYDTTPVVSTAADSASIATNGERLVQVDMPYQDDPAIGSGFAAWLLNLYKTATARPTSVSFLAKTGTRLALALSWDLGTRFRLVEDQSGVDTDVFIQSVRLEATGGALRVTWGLAPADMNSYWLLGTANASELGLTTRLGFA